MAKLTAIIIAKNEELRIERCLKSLGFCDEVVVVDNNSDDKTRQISKQNGATVHEYKSSDYAEARNFGMKLSKTEWVLYVDADEVVSDELKKEILSVIASGSPGFVAYKLRRKNFYLGDNPWPKIESLERLFEVKNFITWEGQLHESVKVSGSVGELKGLLLHYTHRTIAEMVEKTLIWSKVEAELRYKAGHPKVVWWRFPRVIITSFFDSYISQGGWKIGTAGLIESIYQAFSSFITYARLWEMQQKNSKK